MLEEITFIFDISSKKRLSYNIELKLFQKFQLSKLCIKLIIV